MHHRKNICLSNKFQFHPNIHINQAVFTFQITWFIPDEKEIVHVKVFIIELSDRNIIKINLLWNHEGHFSKIAKTAHRASSTELAYSEHSIAIHSISMAGYVNDVPAIVCFELPAREASSFCDFWKLTSCDYISSISSLIEVNFYFFTCAY